MIWEHVKGVDEVIRQLHEFPVKFETNAVRGGLRAMARVVQTAALPNVPVGSGVLHPGASASLRDTLRISTRKIGREVHAKVNIGDRRRGVFYASMVIGGTRPHLIRALNQGFLSFRGNFVRSVQHPGARPNPFLETAFNASREAAVRAGFDYVTARTRKLIEEQGAKAS